MTDPGAFSGVSSGSFLFRKEKDRPPPTIRGRYRGQPVERFFDPEAPLVEPPKPKNQLHCIGSLPRVEMPPVRLKFHTRVAPQLRYTKQRYLEYPDSARGRISLEMNIDRSSKLPHRPSTFSVGSCDLKGIEEDALAESRRASEALSASFLPRMTTAPAPGLSRMHSSGGDAFSSIGDDARSDLTTPMDAETRQRLCRSDTFLYQRKKLQIMQGNVGRSRREGRSCFQEGNFGKAAKCVLDCWDTHKVSDYDCSLRRLFNRSVQGVRQERFYHQLDFDERGEYDAAVEVEEDADDPMWAPVVKKVQGIVDSDEIRLQKYLRQYERLMKDAFYLYRQKKPLVLGDSSFVENAVDLTPYKVEGTVGELPPPDVTICIGQLWRLFRGVGITDNVSQAQTNLLASGIGQTAESNTFLPQNHPGHRLTFAEFVELILKLAPKYTDDKSIPLSSSFHTMMQATFLLSYVHDKCMDNALTLMLEPAMQKFMEPHRAKLKKIYTFFSKNHQAQGSSRNLIKNANAGVVGSERLMTYNHLFTFLLDCELMNANLNPMKATELFRRVTKCMSAVVNISSSNTFCLITFDEFVEVMVRYALCWNGFGLNPNLREEQATNGVKSYFDFVFLKCKRYMTRL
eukprot:Rmarinus@m.1354